MNGSETKVVHLAGRFVLRPLGPDALDCLEEDLRAGRALMLPAAPGVGPGHEVVLDYTLSPTLSVTLRAVVQRVTDTGLVVMPEQASDSAFLVIQLARATAFGQELQ